MSSILGYLGIGSDSSPDSQTGSPVFSYVLLGAAILLLIAVIFGELEAME